jgi:hypothetical protein
VNKPVQFLFFLAAVAYPVLVFVFLAVFKAPIRVFSLLAVLIGLVYFLAAVSKKKRKAPGFLF